MRELTQTSPVLVTAASNPARPKAELIAGRLDLPFADTPPDFGLYLSVGEDGAVSE